jgi:hypothetical protein
LKVSPKKAEAELKSIEDYNIVCEDLKDLKPEIIDGK